MLRKPQPLGAGNNTGLQILVVRVAYGWEAGAEAVVVGAAKGVVPSEEGHRKVILDNSDVAAWWREREREGETMENR
jgi:hypothetical protein